jgi:hypothetical protein
VSAAKASAETAHVTSASKGPTSNRDIEGEALKALARTIAEGEVMTWPAMMEATGRTKEQTRRMWAIVRSSLISDGMVFRAVTGVGYRRWEPEQTVEKVDGRMQSIRRAAHSGIRENRTVDRSRLDARAAAHADTQAILLTAIESKVDEAKPLRLAPSSAPDVPLAALTTGCVQMK